MTSFICVEGISNNIVPRKVALGFYAVKNAQLSKNANYLCLLLENNSNNTFMFI